MDLRVQKTEQRIRSAFIELRKTKPLEKITVKELIEAAVINKGTFYHHYQDIYDLSETLENELIKRMASVITESNLLSAKQIIYDFVAAYTQEKELFDTLFSGNRINGAVQKLETAVKNHVYTLRPFLADNESFEIRLTATIYGFFYAYTYYAGKKQDRVVACLAQYAQDWMDLRSCQTKSSHDGTKTEEP